MFDLVKTEPKLAKVAKFYTSYTEKNRNNRIKNSTFVRAEAITGYRDILYHEDAKKRTVYSVLCGEQSLLVR